MKKVLHTEMSNITCTHRDRTGRNDCSTRIKQNVVNKKRNEKTGKVPNNLVCYAHYCKRRGIDPRARKVNSRVNNTRLHKALDKQGENIK